MPEKSHHWNQLKICLLTFQIQIYLVNYWLASILQAIISFIFFKVGLLSGVPGEIAGYWIAHKIAGRLPWKTLFEPVINLCKNGFAVSPVLAESLKNYKDQIRQNVGLTNILTNPVNGQVYKLNEIIKLPGLAKTLEMISVNGSQVFYDGELSAKIVSENNANGKFNRDYLKFKKKKNIFSKVVSWQ